MKQYKKEMQQKTILKYIEGKATAEETNAIVEWIDAKESNYQEYLSLRRTYELTLWNTSVQNPKSKRELFRFKELLKVAAIFALGIFSFYLFSIYKSTNSEKQLYTRNIIVPEGQRVNVELSDGSNVWVNANSTLRIVENSTNESREVFLDGEAHFDIAHDPDRKFIVKTNKYQMTVLGTEFNVKTISSKDYFEVGLVHGSLEVASLVSSESVLLKPKDKVYAISGSTLYKGIIDEGEFAWIDGILYLNDLTVKEIFEKIEQYYDVDIEVSNTSVLERRFTGKFWINDGVEQVLKVLKLSNNFQYRRIESNENIKIEIY